MVEDLKAQLLAIVSLAGAFMFALIGVAARHRMTEKEFRMAMIFAGVPFAMLCAVIAGGIGSYLGVDYIIRFAVAGIVSFLGPEFLRLKLREKLDARNKPGADDVETE